ncbi:Solute carrier family 25 member 36-A [Oopsacas minuta]|uniref:Solute carrier family 25 member 36-A n=1 Tax=Oopsacas minuta TaxID=111878 RepID=A0AAV7JWS1_9METZ|nr:Solute carrier family 25 member 36-A [Oopsacas minuta]
MAFDKLALMQFTAGAMAGSAAAFITCPIEVFKVRLQSAQVRSVHFTPTNTNAPTFALAHYMQLMFKKEGFFAFYKGLAPHLIGITPSKAIYFLMYERSKIWLGNSGVITPGSNQLHMVSAFIGGSTATTITNPIWVLKTKLQISSDKMRRRGLMNLIKTILRTEGPKGFMRGLSASYVGIGETALVFMVYERLKARSSHRREKISGLDLENILSYVTYAVTAKSIAAMSFYPHEVARTRLREEGRKKKYIHFFQTLRVVFREEGRRGLYGGMSAHLMRVIPSSAVTFVTYECAMIILKNM